MADILPFRRCGAAAAVEDVETPSINPRFDRAAFRARVERSAQAFFDLAHHCFDVLDQLDTDPDFEPDADEEPDGCDEPIMSALVGFSGIRWVGFDGGAA